MGTIAEIELAIQKLPAAQVDELAIWLEAHRERRVPTSFDQWLERARGAVRTGMTTAQVMSLTRGDE